MQIVPQPLGTALTRRKSRTISSRLQSRRLSALNFHFAVSSSVFVLCWWGVFFVHVSSGLFLFFIGASHLLLAKQKIYFNVAWLLHIELWTLRIAGWSYLAVAMVHFIAIARDVRRSISCGRFTFANGETKVAPPKECDPQLAPSSSIVDGQAARVSTWSRFKQRIVSLPAKWRAFHYSFSVHGKHFNVAICVSQVVDILAQTYQVHLFSHTVPEVVLCRVLVVLVVVNCGYLPIVDVLFKRSNPGTHLAALLFVDLILDVAVTVVVPLVIIVPHFLAFDWKQGKLPDIIRFNEVWFVKTLAEVRYVMATSTIDNLSALVPYIAVIESLRTLKIVLMRVVAAPHPAQEDKEPVHETVAIREDADASSPSTVKPIFRRLYKFAMVVACLVLGIQLHAEFRPANRHTNFCLLPMTPWFGQNMSCGVMDLNCHRQGLRGTTEEVTSLLDRMDRSSLTKLLLNHCAELSIPPKITQFPHLLGLQTVNCTLVDWPLTAAISHTHQPKMAEVQLVATNMTQFPLGLLHGDLPAKLSLVIHKSNLTHLPENAGDAWAGHVWPFITFAHVPLKRLPATFNKAAMSFLTLFDNEIESLPEDLFASYEMTRLRLSNNPRLSRLPANLGSAKFLEVFAAEHTNLSQSTPWLEQWWASKQNGTAVDTSAVMSFYGSPLCDGHNGSAADALAQHCTPSGLVEKEDSRFAIVQALRPLTL